MWSEVQPDLWEMESSFLLGEHNQDEQEVFESMYLDVEEFVLYGDQQRSEACDLIQAEEILYCNSQLVNKLPALGMDPH